MAPGSGSSPLAPALLPTKAVAASTLWEKKQSPLTSRPALPPKPLVTGTLQRVAPHKDMPLRPGQVTVFSPYWHQQRSKSKGRGWLNNLSLAKGLRWQVCLELKPKLSVFLQ
ncbi:hypothetical protein J1605_009407 [Eschrichtius robustus]|uniref:Uncharacterized protein n=1 Tax=Eschrichtius robustus TaxID=9764 RepID=A0AB34GTM0_ESCRO|nr:hypothetical protein J1605_009407 [Eschrichtius robustus]